LAFLAAAICLVAAQAPSSNFLVYVPGHVLTYLGFGALVIGAVYTPVSTRLVRWLRPIVVAGEHSYSVYLWHTAVLVFGVLLATRVLGRVPTFYETFVGYVTLALGFGIAMAKAVELPALRLRDWLFPDRLRAESLTPTAVPRSAEEPTAVR
jgi:peptidoglycan/LPS O-acetylase OafA/YrhL